MGGTWSGAFSGELVTSTPHQAKGGVRSAIDMGSLGDVVVTAPPDIDDTSFSVWFLNPNRNLLTIQCSHPIQLPNGSHDISLTTRLKNGVIGFTFINDQWEISDFIPFEVPLGVQAGVTFTGRNTNGLCVLEDAYRIASVERTAIGEYVVTSDGTDVSSGVVSVPQPYAIGLPAAQSGEVQVGAKTATTIDLSVGRRNNGGIFQSDDLVQDAANRVSLFVVKLA